MTLPRLSHLGTAAQLLTGGLRRGAAGPLPAPAHPPRADRARHLVRHLAGVGVATAGVGPIEGSAVCSAPSAPVVARRFARAAWTLYPDGRLLFAPAPGHGARAVFPLPGRYESRGEGWLVRAERTLGPGVGVSVRGLIEPGAGWRFQGRYDSRGAGQPVSLPVTVGLADPRSQPDLLGVSLFAGVPVPLVFQVVLTGTIGATAFGPLPAELAVVDAAPGSAEPVEITLAAPAGHLDPHRVDVEAGVPLGTGAVGEVVWLPRPPVPADARAARRRLVLAGATLDLRLDGGDEASLGVTVNVPAPFLGAMPTPVRDARLVLRFRPGAGGWRVDGRLSARTLAMAGGLAVGCDAVLHGTARHRTLDDPMPTPAAPSRAGAPTGSGGRAAASAGGGAGPAAGLVPGPGGAWSGGGFAGPAWPGGGWGIAGQRLPAHQGRDRRQGSPPSPS
ncbi:hypothetical protein [Frankia sp. AgB32]|uniref:hypothetical protein n=1 Tax=Frankia sp. AgB32 TaxID=631119 RepID=UPI00200D07AA|nr:hypothetical protein [Frankia sp. AgB32]MCK9893674.1 hypothetical protein [Frankia sp. AgB32]